MVAFKRVLFFLFTTLKALEMKIDILEFVTNCNRYIRSLFTSLWESNRVKIFQTVKLIDLILLDKTFKEILKRMNLLQQRYQRESRYNELMGDDAVNMVR